MTPRTRLRGWAAALAAAAAAFAVALPANAAHAASPGGGDLTHLVNPFIGTQDDGNTYPGAAVPFGMVQLSPDTGHDTGYDYNQDHILGFSAVHLSGVGCGLGGDLPTLPTTGPVTQTDDASYAAPFSHSDESASPGSYTVKLGTGITAELTATQRTGWQRYTFPATDQANVMLDAGQALHKVTSSTVTVLDDRTVLTTITGSGFCQDTKPYTLYTETRFDRPFTSFGTWKDKTVTAGSRTSTSTGLGGAYATFDTRKDQQVTAVTALSWTGPSGAAKNLAAEDRGSFDATRNAAEQAWQQRLSQIRVQGGTDEQQSTFYSSLYRSFLAPNIGSDVDGRYTGWDGKVHNGGNSVYYQNWSLWDTYRTQEQLLSLLAPRESRDMALSLLHVAEQGGQLPRWGYATVETNIMTGDPVTPFLVDAWRQGLLKGHEKEAYQLLKQHVDNAAPASSPSADRQADPEYLADGYVPYDPSRPQTKPGDDDYQHGPSATLEYALADAALGGMARDLGYTADARRYLERGQNYRNILNPATDFFQARDAQGAFTGPSDPASSVGFHEGTSWQYMWLVPQDLPGVVDLIGGDDAANARLDSFFAYDQLLQDPAGTARNVWVNGAYSYYNQDKYNPENEPDLSAPYTYLSTGQPWKTTDVVHAALTLFTDAPNGVTGNDDLGTMSAWQVMSSIGIYPMAPGTDEWGISTPVFSRVDISLDRAYYPRGHYTISAPGSSDSDRYIQTAKLGGKRLGNTYLTTEDIKAGRDLSLSLGTEPSSWGTSASAAPPALDHTRDTQRHTSAAVSPSSPGLLTGSGGTDVDVSAVLTGPGKVSGTVSVSAGAPLKATPGSSAIHATSDTLPATTTVPVHITAPAGTPDGDYPLTVTVRQNGGPTATRTVQVAVTTASCTGTAGSCPQDLSTAYDTAGTGTAGVAPSGGGFDGGGYTFPADQLPAQGTGLLGGHAYAFPATTGNAEDFASAHGQTIALTPRSYSALDVLLSAHNGDVTGTGTVHYSDGSTSQVTLNASDWAAGSPRLGEDAAINCTTRYDSKGNADNLAVSIWHVAVPVDSSKTAVSLTLPDDTRMELYALSGRNA